MGEWALPADESLRLQRPSSTHAQDERRPEARWLRGAFWRNFQVKYREINDLHKQMLRTSAKVDAMPPGPAPTSARPRPPLPGPVERLLLARPVRRHLHQPHAAGHATSTSSRPRTWPRPATGALVAAELRDLDLDGHRRGPPGRQPGQVVTVDLDEGAGIGGWDIRAVRHALAAVMRRRPEAYHETLRAQRRGRGGARPRRTSAAVPRPRSTTSSGSRSPASPRGSCYDAYERRCGLVRVLAADRDAPTTGRRAAAIGARRRGRWRVRGRDARPGPAGRRARDGDDRRAPTVTGRPRRSSLGGDRRTPTLELDGPSWSIVDGPAVDARLGLEWTLTMLGGGGNPSAWWEVDGTRTGHDVARRRPAASRALAQGNDYIGVAVETDRRRAGRRLVGADRDRLELGGRLRARLPGQRACSCRGRSRPGAPGETLGDAIGRADRGRRSRPVTAPAEAT